MTKRKKMPYEAIFEGTGLLLVALDSDGRVVAFNQAAEKTTGFTRDEVIGRSMWDFAIPDEAREADAAHLENFRRGELVDTLEQYLLTRDGRKRLISWRATTAGAGKGRPDIILAVGMDITERRLAEEALASSEGFFRMLIEKALDLITVLGAEGRIIYVSPAVERLLGYEQEEMIGRNIIELVHPEEKDMAKAALDFGVSRPGITGNIELRIRHRDGSWSIHEATSFNLLHDPHVKGIVINSRDVTDRKAMEEELRRKSMELEYFMQTLPDLYFRFAADGTVVDYRAGHETFLYKPPEEFMGRKVWEALPVELGEMTRERLREVNERGNPVSLEYELMSPDGLRRYEARLMPAFAGEAVAVIRDITERSRAERLVHVQRDLAMRLGGSSDMEEVLGASLAAVLEASGLDSGGLYLVDADTGALELKCHQGLRPGFIAKTSHFDAGSENVRLVMAGESLYVDYGKMDIPLADLAGAEGLKALAVVPVMSEGRVIGCINVASHSHVDISSQVREVLEILAGQIGQAIGRAALVSSLLESEENYRVTFESTGSAMVVLGLDGTILDANQEMQRLLGYAREDVIGRRKYIEFVHPEDREDVKRYSLRILKGELKGPVRYEARTIRRDGRVLNTIINVSVLPGMDKSVASLVDITKKKDYELELEARAAQLRDFLDIAAHELRHPATLIKGFAMTLADFGGEMSHKEINDSLSAIVRGVEKLTGVVDDLLDVSRIERGFMSLERGEHDLLPLLRSAVDEMLARGGGRAIEIARVDDPGPAWLDPEKFTRLVVILLDNAVKYSPPGSLIEVSLGASGGDALVSVLDRGAGIADRERRRIFDRFYQSDEVLHHSSPGLGLGLYIARRIVEAHGGRIWCEAREGGGSAFRFTIPLRGNGSTF